MNYKFEFSPEIVQLIALGLRKLPYEQSASMLDMLQKDCAAQEAAAQKASEAVKRAADAAVAEVKERKKPGRKPKEANGAAEQQPAA